MSWSNAQSRDPAAILLRELVRDRTGIFINDDNLDIFMDKLSTLVVERGFSTALDYYYLLKYDSEAETEWPRVVDAISVRETYFWREFDQIRTLVDIILPAYFVTAREPFRIWSAACASGEEPLTIAMAIDQAGYGGHAIEIRASDASPAAIRSARSGIFRDWSFRSIPPAIKERYFVKSERGWKVDPAISAKVQWQEANLTQQKEIDLLARSHAIFCRNVFLYFKPETIREIVKHFAGAMKEPAYLFMGAAESLLKLTTDFELQQVGNSFVYRRSSSGKDRRSA